jgi:hypothetical protein
MPSSRKVGHGRVRALREILAGARYLIRNRG